MIPEITIRNEDLFEDILSSRVMYILILIIICRTRCLLFAQPKNLLKAGINRVEKSVRIIRVYATQGDYLTTAGIASEEWLTIIEQWD